MERQAYLFNFPQGNNSSLPPSNWNAQAHWFLLPLVCALLMALPSNAEGSGSLGVTTVMNQCSRNCLPTTEHLEPFSLLVWLLCGRRCFSPLISLSLKSTHIDLTNIFWSLSMSWAPCHLCRRNPHQRRHPVPLWDLPAQRRVAAVPRGTL